MTSTGMTAADIERAVYHHFTPRYAVVFQVTARPDAPLRDKLAAALADGTPTQDVVDSHHLRRIDVLLVRRAPRRPPTQRQLADHFEQAAQGRRDGQDAALFPPIPAARPATAAEGDDGGLDRLALEIKVSRGDFLGDVRNPHKQAPWRALAHRHAYCVPAGLVAKGEVPAESGLLEVHPSGLVKWAKTAPRTTATPLPLANQLDAFYRWARAEAVARGITRVQEGSPEQLRADLALALHRVELLEKRVEREVDNAARWQRRCAALEPLPCSTCGQPLRPARKSTDTLWEHAVDQERLCFGLRMAAAGGQRWRARSPYPRYDWDTETDGCTVSAERVPS